MSESPFTVSVAPYVREDRETVEDVYIVSIPHQCDEWEVAWGDKQQAAAGLRQFISDAQTALTELEALDPCLHQWRDDGKRNTNNAGLMGLFRCDRCDSIVWRVLDKSTAAPWFAAQHYAEQTT